MQDNGESSGEAHVPHPHPVCSQTLNVSLWSAGDVDNASGTRKHLQLTSAPLVCNRLSLRVWRFGAQRVNSQ